MSPLLFTAKRLSRIALLTLLCLCAIAAVAQTGNQTTTNKLVALPGSTPVGASAAQQSLTITIARGGTLTAAKVLTQGAPASDFAQSPGGTCTPGATFLPNQRCTLNLAFTPTVPGQRRGAIVLLDSSGNALATQFLVASATGAVGTFLPGTIQTVAGNEAWIYAGDGNLATSSSIFLPFGLAVDAAGNLFLADSSNNRIRRVDAVSGLISTVAGTGVIGSSGDNGPATAAALSSPASIALDPAGNLYLADSGNNAIRRIDAFTGIITTIAGTLNVHGYTGDNGPATAATLNTPNGITFDPAGNLYLADTGNHVVRRVDPSGIITTIAGRGFAVYSGDGGPAVSAGLSSPWSVTTAPDGSLYIADQNNNRIRKISPSGTITTVAGTGVASFSGDAGPATLAGLNVPASVALDVAGNLYIADSGNNRIRKISSKTGIITTIAGNSGESISGDNGPADAAGLYGPYTLAIDSQGALLIADVFHNRIRKVFSNAAILNFPPQRVGRISAVSLNELFENDGNAPLDIATLDPTSQSRLDPGNTTCAVTTPLAPLDQCTLALQFMPTITGDAVQGLFSVKSNAANTPSIVTLTGQVLNVDPATAVLTSSTNPSTTGSPVTFSVTVTSAGATPTGQITLLDGTATLNTGQLQAGGLFAFTTSALTSGQHSITAAYAGDSSNSAAVSPAVLQIVKDQQAATTTTLATAATPTDAGATIRLTASVAVTTAGSGTGPISGNVAFKEGLNTLGVVAITDGATATLTLSNLAPGTHTISAAYAGISTYAASSSQPITQVVQIATTRLAISTSANPGTAGTALTLTGVTLSTGGTATGAVTFFDAGHPLGTTSLDGTGTATLVTPAATWTPGTHSLTASYAGDTFDSPANSPAFTETITFAKTSATLVSSANPSPQGGPVTLTAAVVGTGSTPTGQVQFLDGALTLGTAALTPQGAATLTLATLTLGDHTLTAAYPGDPYNSPTQSPTLKQTINPTNIAITLASSENPALFADSVTLEITVTGTGANPTGTVTLTDGATPLITSPIDAKGNATFTTASLALGAHSLTAAYSGDTTHTPATSTLLTQHILQVTTLTLAASPQQQTAGLPITFTLALTGKQGQPTPGPITISEGSTIIATLATSGTFTTSALPVGPHIFIATYPGDTLNAPITSTPFLASITFAQTTLTLATSNNPADAGSPVTFTAALTSPSPNPTGSITFRDGTAPLTTIPLTSNQATLTLATLTPGIHAITATYSGDPFNTPTTSPTLSQQIARKTTVALTSSANPSLLTDTITLTLTVANGTPTTPPTGTIRLTDGSTTLATLPLTAGAATYTMPSPALGPHTLTATYSGDNENSPATAQPLLQTVTLRPSATTFTPSSTALSAGQQLILISVVQASGPRPPTGTVTFTAGTQNLGTAAINSAGIATLALSPAQALGPTTATYSGDTLYATSTSSIVNITVGPPIEFNLTATPTAITLKSGDRTTITLNLTTAPTYADTLAFGCAGLPAYATCTFSANQLPVGGGLPHTLTVTLDTGNPLGAGTQATNATPASPVAFAIFPAMIFLALFHPKRKPRPRKLLTLLITLGVLTATLTGCGTQFTQRATPAGSYAFQIVASGAHTTATNTAAIQLEVTK